MLATDLSNWLGHSGNMCIKTRQTCNHFCITVCTATRVKIFSVDSRSLSNSTALMLFKQERRQRRPETWSPDKGCVRWHHHLFHCIFAVCFFFLIHIRELNTWKMLTASTETVTVYTEGSVRRSKWGSSSTVGGCFYNSNCHICSTGIFENFQGSFIKIKQQFIFSFNLN